MLRAAAAVTTIWLVGWAFLDCCRATSPSRHATRASLGATWLAGVLVVTVVVLAQVQLGIVMSAAPVVVALTLSATLGAWRIREARARSVATTAPVARAPLAAALLLGGATLLFATLAVRAWAGPIEWDGYAIWTFKARALTLPVDFSTRYLQQPAYAFSHLDYPLAVPSVTWWLATVGDMSVPRAASVAGVCWAVALADRAWWAMRRRGAPGWLAALAVVVVAADPVTRTGAVSGYADIAVAMSLLAAALALDALAASGAWRDALEAAVAAGVAAATKSEGAIIAAIAILVGVALAWRAPRERRVRLALPWLVPIAMMVTWHLVLTTHGVDTRLGADLANTAGAEASRLARALERVGPLVHGLAAYATLPSIATALLLAVLGAIAAIRGAPAPRRWIPAPSALLVAGYAAILAASYLVLADEIHWLMDTTLRRVFAGPVLAGALLGAASLAASAWAGPRSGTGSSDRAASTAAAAPR